MPDLLPREELLSFMFHSQESKLFILEVIKAIHVLKVVCVRCIHW